MKYNQHNQSEIDLVKKYLEGQYTEVQLNYWIVQNNFDKQKIENLIQYIKITQPFLLASKLIVGFMLFNFILSLIISIIHTFR